MVSAKVREKSNIFGLVIKTIEWNKKDLYLFFYFKWRHLKNFGYCGRSPRGTC